MSYYIYYVNKDGHKMYLTSIGNENPLAGIGFQGGHGTIPSAAGTTPTVEDAEKVIEYLKEAICGRPEVYQYELVVE
ncbi:hypothetical protein D3C76_705310 [compost metagenome]